MSIDLLGVLGKFEDASSRETEDAYFRTHVPEVGSGAYLNIVYKAPASAVLQEVERELRLPATLLEFYNAWNGARLFVGALSVYGCLPAGQRIDRTDPLKLLPYDIREVNREFAMQTKVRGLLCIGSYSYDRSIVCMRREPQSVVCYVGTEFSKVRQEWSGVEQWLSGELSRLSLLFDADGKRLVAKESLLPGLDPSRVV
jgi:hypothetical protein